MTTTPSTVRQLLLSGLIVALILTTAIILGGPPTLTNKILAKVLVQGDAAVLARVGYYGAYCALSHCLYLPLIVRQLVNSACPFSHCIYLPKLAK